jgi:predicted enzyme related to lactoylglutathione lyase
MEVQLKIKAKYVHTNLIAEHWKELAHFYEEIFDCKVIPPERDFRGKDIEAGTGIKNVHLQGVHLQLPGYKENGPTLEIFKYSPQSEKQQKEINSPGYGHIAFQVDNVGKAKEIILNNGGREIGEIVTLQVGSDSKVTWCYVTDPEGNVIELQSWS